MELIVRDRVINKDILDILSDIQSSCSNGKLSQYRISGRSIAVTCPIHSDGKEKRPSCFINIGDESIDYGHFHCFTCGSGGVFSKFVGECFNRSQEWGEDWLIANYASDYVNQGLILPEIDLNKKESVFYLDDSVLDDFESYHPYMDKRHLKPEICKRFDIKYDPELKMIVFPVRDINGRIKFLTRRSVEGKKFLIDKGADKSDIYLLNEIVKDNIKTVVVVEAQISALTLWGWGIPAIALFGAGTSEEQINALNKTGIRHYILCYDNDSAGKKGAGRFMKYINNDVFIDELEMPLGKDPNDMTEEEFRHLVSLQLGDCIL